jgi:hypothetical protein
MNRWQDPNLSLGERCVAFAENEMKNGVSEDSPRSFTSPRLREYFKICTRIIKGKEVSIGKNFTAGNWCSAGVSFCLHESILSNETAPHGYRLGVVEVMADMQKLGTYHSVANVKAKTYNIKVGDIIFFDRSNPNNPASAWWRHIGRVYSVEPNGKFTCISGNSGGKWRISKHDFNQKTLLGFGEYKPVQVVSKVSVPIDWDHLDLNALAPMEDTGKDLSVKSVWSIFDKFK